MMYVRLFIALMGIFSTGLFLSAAGFQKAATSQDSVESAAIGISEDVVEGRGRRAPSIGMAAAVLPIVDVGTLSDGIKHSGGASGAGSEMSAVKANIHGTTGIRYYVKDEDLYWQISERSNLKNFPISELKIKVLDYLFLKTFSYQEQRFFLWFLSSKEEEKA